jgi:hypothetical protein
VPGHCDSTHAARWSGIIRDEYGVLTLPSRLRTPPGCARS